MLKIKKIVTIYALLPLIVVSVFCYRDSYALSSSPIISGMCIGEASAATAALNAPIVQAVFFGQTPGVYVLGGVINLIFEPLISPSVKIVFCDGDAIAASFMIMSKHKVKYATAEINALNTRTDKQFSEKESLAATENNSASTLPVQSADNVYRASRTSNDFILAEKDYVYLNSIFQRYETSYSTVTQSESRTDEQTALNLNSVNVFGVDDISAGGVVGGNSAAYNYVLNITAPYPLQPVPISAMRGPRGAEMFAAHNMTISQVLLAQEIFSSIISLHVPVQQQTAWHQGVEAQTGISPVGVNTGNTGMVSVMSNLAHDVQSKFNNPLYVQEISANSIKRRVAQLWGAEQPLGLELDYYNMLFAQQTSAAYAEILARLSARPSLTKQMSYMTVLPWK